MVKTTDHGFALGGFTFSYGNGLADFWLVKTDSIGNKEWDQTFGGEGADRARSLIQTSYGGFALAGTIHSFGAKESDFLLVKTDYLGNMEWRRTYGSSDLESAYCMVETSDGGYALAGHKHSDGGGYSYVWLVKTDASGTLEWNQKYGGKGGDRAVGLVEDF